MTQEGSRRYPEAVEEDHVAGDALVWFSELVGVHRAAGHRMSNKVVQSTRAVARIT
jgi:hypothetical protein